MSVTGLLRYRPKIPNSGEKSKLVTVIGASVRKKFWLLALGPLAFLLTASPVPAAPSIFGDPPSFVEKRGDTSRPGVGLDEAVSRVRRQTDGKILSADTIVVEGRDVHRIKVLTGKGRVQRLKVDAQSGRRVRPRR